MDVKTQEFEDPLKQYYLKKLKYATEKKQSFRQKMKAKTKEKLYYSFKIPLQTLLLISSKNKSTFIYFKYIYCVRETML